MINRIVDALLRWYALVCAIDVGMHFGAVPIGSLAAGLLCMALLASMQKGETR